MERSVKDMSIKIKINIFSWIAVLCWMAIIFMFSSQSGKNSNNLSIKVTKTVVYNNKVTYNLKKNNSLDSLNYFVRKNAHFFMYLVLCVLVSNAFRKSGIEGISFVILSLSFCFLYAISDEFHQLFVQGREPRLKDVIIDSFGVLVGLIIYLTICRLKFFHTHSTNFPIHIEKSSKK